MKQVAVVIAPGRGTYNAAELGYLARHHRDKSDLIGAFDAYRQAQGQESLSELDKAKAFSPKKHLSGDNASGLIYAASYMDFLSIDRDRFEIAAVTGNSMGWYTALACAGALNGLGGLTLVNTMGTLMQTHMIGGQVLYPVADDNWIPSPERRADVIAKVAEIDTKAGLTLGLSIDLGGVLVLAGNKAGLAAFEADMPKVDDKFPMRLPGHAGFHTAMQAPVAKAGRDAFPADQMGKPTLPLIDGRGHIWQTGASDPAKLWDYTLGHQVVEPYDFAAAIRVAAREFMPDVFIVLGPGTTMGGSVAQSLIQTGWRDWQNRDDFRAAQTAPEPRLLSMGMPPQRALVTKG